MKFFTLLIVIITLTACEMKNNNSETAKDEILPSKSTADMVEPGSSKPVFNHIALPVTDFEKSARFYREVIGLDTISNPFNDGKHIWFDIGAKSALHIIGGATSKMEHPRDNHICFSVSSVDNYIDKLVSEKISYEDAKGKINSVTVRPDGVKQIYFKDPDGYWIEINDAKK